MKQCPHCGAYMQGESIGWKCPICKTFVDMNGGVHLHKEAPFMPPQTNADRIRSMTNEELAEVLVEPHCDRRTTAECKSYHGNCQQCVLDWLKQPAEGQP